MPSPEAILEHLVAVANEAWPLAVLWHLVIMGWLLALVAGWRPRRRTAAMLLALPLASVSVLAFAFGNPFNGVVFGLVAALTAGFGSRLDNAPIRFEPAPEWTVFAGAALVAFGLFYPHFLETDAALAYLVAAPTGLVPCPTLALVIGSLLLTDGLSRPLESTLALAGLLYGVLGVFVLGVTLDIPLLLGSLALVAQAALHPPVVRNPPAQAGLHTA